MACWSSLSGWRNVTTSSWYLFFSAVSIAKGPKRRTRDKQSRINKRYIWWTYWSWKQKPAQQHKLTKVSWEVQVTSPTLSSPNRTHPVKTQWNPKGSRGELWATRNLEQHAGLQNWWGTHRRTDSERGNTHRLNTQRLVNWGNRQEKLKTFNNASIWLLNVMKCPPDAPPASCVHRCSAALKDGEETTSLPCWHVFTVFYIYIFILGLSKLTR